jgi:hypothetical protein
VAGGKTIFSGEPLPLAPGVNDLELDAFHRKLLDYLRRLGAKLNQFVGQGAVEALVAYIDTQSTFVSYTSISWDHTLWIDSPFENNGTYIRVLVDGLYVFHVDVLVPEGFTLGNIVIELIGPSGTTFYPLFSLCRFETFSYAMTISLPLLADTQIRVQLKTNIAVTDGLQASGTRLTIMRIRDDARGGDVPGGIITPKPPFIPEWAEYEPPVIDEEAVAAGAGVAGFLDFVGYPVGA